MSLLCPPSLNYDRSVCLLPLVDSRGREGLSRKRTTPFSDNFYFLQVFSLLETVRKEKGLSLRQLTRRASVKEGLIGRAEKHGIVPPSRDFKAWAQALGFSWHEIWSISHPVADSRGDGPDSL